jgi:hypothetical protein
MKRIRFISCLLVICLTLSIHTFSVNGSVSPPKVSRQRNAAVTAVSLPFGKSYQDDERMGTADTLTGNVYTLAIFISTPKDPWKYEDKLKAYQRQREAQDWLVAQAEEYDVELSFQGGNYGLYNGDISVPYIPVSDRDGKGMYTDWGAYLLKKIGYKSPVDLWTSIKKKTGCDNLQVIIYSNTTGVSYAMAYKPKLNTDKYFVEVSFLHRYSTSGGVDLNPSKIAHEMLHLYGAWDLYNSYKHERDVASKAKEHFPNDIMYRSSNDLNDLEVDELTAWRIGWNDEKESWYDWFDPDK